MYIKKGESIANMFKTLMVTSKTLKALKERLEQMKSDYFEYLNFQRRKLLFGFK